MKRKYLLLILSLVIFAGSAYADTSPLDWKNTDGGCFIAKFCKAQSAAGVCTSNGAIKGAGNQAIVFDARSHATLTMFGHESTATGYSCTPHVHPVGYDIGSAENTTFDPATYGIDNTTQTRTIRGFLGEMWLECAAPTGGTVTITIFVCPADRS